MHCEEEEKHENASCTKDTRRSVVSHAAGAGERFRVGSPAGRLPVEPEHQQFEQQLNAFDAQFVVIAVVQFGAIDAQQFIEQQHAFRAVDAQQLVQQQCAVFAFVSEPFFVQLVQLVFVVQFIFIVQFGAVDAWQLILVPVVKHRKFG